MTRLASVFLANVVMYLDSYKTAQMFIQISKSAQISVDILKKNPLYKPILRHPGISEPTYRIDEQISLVKELLLFPNIQTLSIPAGQINLVPFLNNADQIDVPLVCDVFSVDKTIQNKLIDVAVDMDDRRFCFKNNFMKCRKVSFEYTTGCEDNLFKVFGVQRYYDFLRVFLSKTPPLRFFENLQHLHFKKVVLEPKTINVLKNVMAVPNILDIGIVTFHKWFYGINPSVIISTQFGEMQIRVCPNEKVSHKLINKYLPLKAFVTTPSSTDFEFNVDLSQLLSVTHLQVKNEFLQILSPETVEKLDAQNIPVNSTHVKLKNVILGFSNKVETLPKTVTSLSISKREQIRMIDCDALKELCLNRVDMQRYNLDLFSELTKLTLRTDVVSISLKNLTKLKVLNVDRCHIDVKAEDFFPKKLEQLTCLYTIIPERSDTITRLVLRGCDDSTNLLEYKKLKELIVYDLRAKNTYFPDNLESLSIVQNMVTEIYLQYYKTLYQISFQSGYASVITFPQSCEVVCFEEYELKASNLINSRVKQLVVLSSVFDLEQIPESLQFLKTDKKEGYQTKYLQNHRNVATFFKLLGRSVTKLDNDIHFDLPKRNIKKFKKF
ncbi:hypothetical protein EIN_170800 [Entamoeba invadens IP1]|uniref:LRR containing protein n=1 Tax=Entamoeba invadens IP1 TaxID=370355 RepID=A0A0A1TYC2_ENTIV|nr:hypothetical protein EIN_170800 [Entamoeba invadens IP1]ELP84545.1 hypothetical protein EIN_170800 [Entamoeba invadens IP1]|eukprot:XP_004183891.1 hypothetical protein EIN_170800 [Entamoeba invadens IP1]